MYRFLTPNFSQTKNKYENTTAFTMPVFTKLTIIHWVFPDICCAKFYPNSMSNVQHMGKISFTPLSKLCLSLHGFHETCNYSTLLHWDFYIGFHPNWSRNVESTSKNSFTHLTSSDCHWTNFHETHSCLTNFCKEFLHQISWNLTNSLVTDTKLYRWLDRCGLHKTCFFSCTL